jgi:hypothetical protein
MQIFPLQEAMKSTMAQKPEARFEILFQHLCSVER